MLDTNIYHVTILAKMLLPQLVNRGKATALIVNSSSACLKMYPAAFVYTATKAFATQLTEGLAIELKDTNVDVQCLNPFGTATNIVSHWGLGLIGTPCHKVIAKSLSDLGRSKDDCL